MSIYPLAGIGAALAGVGGVVAQAIPQTGSFLQSLTGGENNPPPAAATANADKLTTAINELRQKLQAAGVDLSDPVKLQPLKNGGLEVGHFRHDTSVIDAVLAANPALVDQITSLLPADGELRIGASEV